MNYFMIQRRSDNAWLSLPMGRSPLWVTHSSHALTCNTRAQALGYAAVMATPEKDVLIIEVEPAPVVERRRRPFTASDVLDYRPTKNQFNGFEPW